MLPLYDAVGDDVIACEVCDRPVCLVCQPEGIGKCAGSQLFLHCYVCAQTCDACNEDLRAAMNLDAERGK